MLSVMIAILVGAGVGFFVGNDLESPGWGVVTFIVTALLAQVVISLLIRRRVAGIQKEMERAMLEGQAKINRQMTVFQSRPNGNVKAMQQILEKLQREAVEKTLALTDRYRPYYKWNTMLSRQVCTMRMQLAFQLRNFEEVDRLLPKALVMDPRSRLIKLVRMFKKNDPKLEKFYRSRLAKLKGDDGALAALTYAWMMLKNGENEKAVAALVAAAKLSDNPTLLENRDRLVNGKVKHFSNANLGDIWYSLYLEEPKVKVQQVRQQRMY